LQTSESTAQVQIDKYQAVSMFTDRFTFLQSNHLPEIVRADVIKLDVPNHRATLSNFEYMENGIGNRRVVRVMPKSSVDSEIIDKRFNRSVRAELADISQEGMAIYISRINYKPWQFAQGVEARITLRLPGEFSLTGSKAVNTGSLSSNAALDRFSSSKVRFNPASGTGSSSMDNSATSKVNNPEIQVNAIVKNVMLEASHSRYRLGLKIARDEVYSILVSQFIAQRQSEIIREVQWMYDLIMKKVG
jgi:hypothetical protein